MKITLISTILSEETTGWIFDFLHSLENEGHAVTVIRGTKKYTGLEKPCAGLTFRQVRLFPRKLGSNFLRMLEEIYFIAAAALKLLLLPGQDAVIGMTSPIFVHFAVLPHMAFRNSRVKFILWVMDCHPELEVRLGMLSGGGMVARGMRLANRLFAGKIAAVVALDDAMRDVLAGRYRGTPAADRIVTIPNWNSSLGAADPVGRPTFWEKSRYAGRVRFLYAGNAGRVHEFDTLLKAARRIQDIPACDAVFVFSGYGHARSRIAEQIAELGLTNCFLEEVVPRDCLEAVISRADVTTITLREGMGGLSSPSKAYTSLMLAKPILYIGPAAGNVHEALERHECGIAVKNGDVERCAAGIQRLTLDAAYRETLSRNAREAYETEYNPDNSFSAFRALLGV